MSYSSDDDFAEYVDRVAEVLDNELELQLARLPKRYIRDVENPLEMYSDEEFILKFRFRKVTITEVILPLLMNGLLKHNRRGLPISPLQQLLIAIRFYATASYQLVCADLAGISQSTVCNIIHRISKLLVQQFPTYIKFPTTYEHAKDMCSKFYAIAMFPDVAGIIGCTHIRIESPGGQAEVFRNRKGQFSFNIQAVVGPDLELLDLVARWAGSVPNSKIFARSGVRMKFEEHMVRGHLLGDIGYPLRPYLLTPFLTPQTESQERYNAAQKCTRNVVEQSFRAWKRRFPCLKRGLGNSLPNTLRIILATAVLHNISIQQKEPQANDEFEWEEEVQDPADDIVASNDNESQTGQLYRQSIVEQRFTR